MKATGIVRRMDDLGRVVIPKEIRRTLGVKEGDALEMYVDSETGGLILVPYFSTASDKLVAIAENLSSMGCDPEEWKIADEIRKIAKKLKKIQENS